MRTMQFSAPVIQVSPRVPGDVRSDSICERGSELAASCRSACGRPPSADRPSRMSQARRGVGAIGRAISTARESRAERVERSGAESGATRGPLQQLSRSRPVAVAVAVAVAADADAPLRCAFGMWSASLPLCVRLTPFTRRLSDVLERLTRSPPLTRAPQSRSQRSLQF